MLGMFCSMSNSAKVLVVVVPPALVPGWADKTAAACWVDLISTDKALPCSNWSILEDIVARAVVRFPSVCVNSIMVELSSILVSSLDWNSGGG